MKCRFFSFLLCALLCTVLRANPCNNNVIYDCDFEGATDGWTFAKADGISTGFSVGSAVAYRGANSLYISPDMGLTTGYTQDNAEGYVSVAYKTIYLDTGTYVSKWNYRSNLSYLDIDNDYCKAAIVPATNIIEPLDYYEYYPSFLDKSVVSNTYSSNNSSWVSTSNRFTITEAGDYHLVFAFIATDTITNELGIAIDDISITSVEKLFYTETLDGVLVKWTGDYPEYRIYWYCSCDNLNKYDTISENQYLIPYSALREAVYGRSMFHFYLTPMCDSGETGDRQSMSFDVETAPFPSDTCPSVPRNLKAENTALGVRVIWQGNTDKYDFKYGRNYNGCSFEEEILNIHDTTCLIPYKHLENETYYFFVRGICDSDTSIWRSVSLLVRGTDACESDVCYARPCKLYAQNIADGIHLTWHGNATEYEIEARSEDEYYRSGNRYTYVDSNYVRFTTTEPSYTIPYNTLPDTLYHFRVRAICEQDTSYWTDYISAYNINFGEYCIPFFDLCGPNTECTYGSFHNPYSTKRTLDYRQKDWAGSYSHNESGYRYGIDDYTNYRSRHTICFEGETDSHCDYELTTVPPGEKYSMRLGNWYNGEGESVTFTHKINKGFKLVLLLKYAVVLQDPSHSSEENPHFTLEILDENDQLIDSECLFADFAADKNAEGWKNAVNAHEPTSEEFRNVVWKDWTTIGVNLSDLSKYSDRTIKIRLTTKDCTRGQHYGYAYFTLQCTTGDMEGMHCGERPIKFEVAQGFKYRWYLMDDTTKTQVSDSNVFFVQPLDTNSYHVDMISLENDECFYTLNAYTLPRLPRPEATFEHTPHDCINEVTVHNDSYVYKIMLDGSEQLDGRVVIDSILWDFGKYGTSNEIEPKLVVPNEGDTFNISLRVVAMDCPEVQEYTLYVPAIGDITTYTYVGFCEGDTLYYGGKEYTTPTQELLEHTTSQTGCDSISYLVVHYLDPQPIDLYDTICTLMLPYDFYGQSCQQSGVYEQVLQSQGGCDSMIYHLNLQVFDALEVHLNNVPEICMGDPSFDLPYTVTAGEATKYNVYFSEEAKAQGFVDSEGVTDASNLLTIPLPSSPRPDVYTATVAFDNHGCEAVKLPLSIPIFYSSDVITQRWNDVLAVRQSAFDHYEGFTTYQWYCNDVAIDGANLPTYYLPSGLHGNTYRVELTRIVDGVKTMSCPYSPTDEPSTSTLVVQPNATQPQAIMQVSAPESGIISIITHTGRVIEYLPAEAGQNVISAPVASGIYLMCLTTSTGSKYVQKIIVY